MELTISQAYQLNPAGTLEEYFSLPEAPAANSPVGSLMLAVLKKFPGETFDLVGFNMLPVMDGQEVSGLIDFGFEHRLAR